MDKKRKNENKCWHFQSIVIFPLSLCVCDNQILPKIEGAMGHTGGTMEKCLHRVCAELCGLSSDDQYLP